jgi:DNA-binding transcriptional ArsR family regulator
MTTTLAERLDATFSALSDPTRRAILARLAEGEASVMQLAAPFAMSQPAISKHIKVLERAGLVARGRDAQRRPCRLVAAPLGEVAAWLERYRQLWEGAAAVGVPVARADGSGQLPIAALRDPLVAGGEGEGAALDDDDLAIPLEPALPPRGLATEDSPAGPRAVGTAPLAALREPSEPAAPEKSRP